MSESNLHRHVCEFLKLQHPDVIFRTDFAAGIKMTMNQAVKHKRMQHGRAYPDLFVAEARGGYHGLYLELKREGERVFLKDGSLSKNAHIREQAAMLDALRDRGYAAYFAVGFEEAREKLDSYLNQA